MFLFVGLGNPGKQYEDTRHNIGFLLVDFLAAEANLQLTQSRFGCLVGRGDWHGHDVFFAKPQSFMNLSGESVQQMLGFFKLHEQNLVVLFDDLDQSFGAVRTRLGGGHGGHNGVRDILLKTGKEKFYRVKVGIGKPTHKGATTQWVLGKFSDEEKHTLYSESFPLAKTRIIEMTKFNKH